MHEQYEQAANGATIDVDVVQQHGLARNGRDVSRGAAFSVKRRGGASSFRALHTSITPIQLF
jgi:hypothetical protein